MLLAQEAKSFSITVIAGISEFKMTSTLFAVLLTENIMLMCFQICLTWDVKKESP